MCAKDVAPFFFEVAVDKPLYQLFTYQYHEPISVGSRVLVPFARKKLVGIVISHKKKPPNISKPIKSIELVLQDPLCFPQEWIDLIQFTSSYYLYPIGQTFFQTLPVALKRPKPIKECKTPTQFYHWAETSKQPAPRNANLQALLDALKTGWISLTEAKHLHPRASFYLKKYQEDGLVTSRSISELYHHEQRQLKELNTQQKKASQTILKQLHHFRAFLLFGVTGSGKTEVYFHLIQAVLQQKKQVLILLPIINLAPQFLVRLQEIFPEISIAVLHSQVPQSKRLENYLNAAKGNSQVIIGTRLAIFTPILHLGLIIVDEEHDESFKQNNELRYQARDLAVWRAQYNQCPVVLGSATPSLGTWYQATRGQYELLTLPHRAVKEASSPQVELISTQHIKLFNGCHPYIWESIKQEIEQKKLVLVYLNRRGYAPAIVCFECGYSFTCEYCSTKLVYHQQQKVLRCHHCDYKRTVPEFCPSCGHQELTPLGWGTERIKESLHERFPSARIVRVDSDTISSPKEWQVIYEEILANRVDILVGTQILAKGHDFKQLSLVVVLNADSSLFSADYRATEKLFSELMQVAGRPGRHINRSKVLIQSQFIEHNLFQSLQKQDYPRFAQQQLKERLVFEFPPQYHYIAVKAQHLHYLTAEQFLKEIKQALLPPPTVKIVGPVPMNRIKLANLERSILYLISNQRIPLHQLAKVALGKILVLQSRYRQVKWSIDVDPYDT
ncbi:MAG: primosomal protein N' [Neisseriaceae bacterium]